MLFCYQIKILGLERWLNRWENFLWKHFNLSSNLELPHKIQSCTCVPVNLSVGEESHYDIRSSIFRSLLEMLSFWISVWRNQEERERKRKLLSANGLLIKAYEHAHCSFTYLHLLHMLKCTHIYKHTHKTTTIKNNRNHQSLVIDNSQHKIFQFPNRKAHINKMDLKMESVLYCIHFNIKNRWHHRVKCWKRYSKQSDIRNKLV